MSTPATVTVRVTANPWSRAEARETCSHDGSKAGQEREVEAEREKVKGDANTARLGVSPYWGGNPLSTDTMGDRPAGCVPPPPDVQVAQGHLLVAGSAA